MTESLNHKQRRKNTEHKKRKGLFFGLALTGLVLFSLFGFWYCHEPSEETGKSDKVSDNGQATPDYQAGYDRGFSWGVHDGKMSGRMPREPIIKIIAEAQIEKSKAVNADEWKKGFVIGYPKGFRSIKPFVWRSEEYEKLCWDNAKPGVMLYERGEEKYECTIKSSNQEKDTIWIRYRDGNLQVKSMEAASQFWFVRKDDPKLEKCCIFHDSQKKK